MAQNPPILTATEITMLQRLSLLCLQSIPTTTALSDPQRNAVDDMIRYIPRCISLTPADRIALRNLQTRVNASYGTLNPLDANSAVVKTAVSPNKTT